MVKFKAYKALFRKRNFLQVKIIGSYFLVINSKRFYRSHVRHVARECPGSKQMIWRDRTFNFKLHRHPNFYNYVILFVGSKTLGISRKFDDTPFMNIIVLVKIQNVNIWFSLK